MTQNIDFQALVNSANYGAQAARQALSQQKQFDQRLAEQQRAYEEMRNILSRLEVQSRYGDPGIQRVENIPGRRVPFDMLVSIQLPTGSAAVRQGTITINQEGPFVAVARSLSLVSAYEAVYTDPDTSAQTRFNGRSYGRFRPIHSAWDLNDGRPVTTVSMVDAFPGNGAPHFISPSNASSFRSMGGDFTVTFRNQGSSFPRSNYPVPSTMWTKAINSPWELGALDVFERGQVMEFDLTPLHVANPAAGNVSGFAPANALWPFIESQYDAVEGVNDPALAGLTTDPILRQANAIAIIGFHGFLIVQQPGIPQGG